MRTLSGQLLLVADVTCFSLSPLISRFSPDADDLPFSLFPLVAAESANVAEE